MVRSAVLMDATRFFLWQLSFSNGWHFRQESPYGWWAFANLLNTMSWRDGRSAFLYTFPCGVRREDLRLTSALALEHTWLLLGTWELRLKPEVCLLISTLTTVDSYQASNYFLHYEDVLSYGSNWFVSARSIEYGVEYPAWPSPVAVWSPPLQEVILASRTSKSTSAYSYAFQLKPRQMANG